MITTRDLEVVEWLTTYKCAKTSVIKDFFYPSLNVAQKRLKQLFDEGYLGRCRDSLNMEYIYYIKKPAQIRHSVLLTNFYSQLNHMVDVAKFEREIPIDNIIPDGLAAYRSNNKNYLAFIEIQMQFNKPDIDKYINLYHSHKYKNYFPVFPKVIFVTNRNFNTDKCEFEVIRIKEDLSDINKILD